MNILYDKSTVLDYLWQYSRFSAYCLDQGEELFRSEKGFSAITVLFNCLENISKSIVNDYNSSTYDIYQKLLDNGVITQIEHDFLNQGDNCIRKIRNYYAHKNIAAINYVTIENGREILNPLTEDTTSLLIYDKISDIVYNLILKMISSVFIEEVKNKFQISLDDNILACDIKLKFLTVKELLVLKGYPEDYISDDLDIPEDAKYRIIDNSPDVNIYMHILSGILGHKENGGSGEDQNGWSSSGPYLEGK